MNPDIHIIGYNNSLAPYFRDLNLAWVERYFKVEPLDRQVLSDPGTHIIGKGGHVFFALYNGQVVGTFALMKVEEDTFELAKMAVHEGFRGLKVGNALMQFALDQGKALGARRLVLYSNTILEPAIHLYRKYGFVEVPLGATVYQRSNIKMERILA